MRNRIFISIDLSSPWCEYIGKDIRNEQHDYNIGKIKHIKNQVLAKSSAHKNWLSISTSTEDGEVAIYPGSS